MSKRYGRNQKRKRREEIAALKTALTVEQMNTSRALYAIRNAEEAAFQRFMRATGLFRDTLERMADKLGRAAGEKYRDEIQAAMGRLKPDISLYSRPTIQAKVVRVSLPALGLEYAVFDSDMENNASHD
ncbi:MAG: hypothetical protein ACK5VI_03380 [Opitutia bacterium]|jgi:hypothetical protein